MKLPGALRATLWLAPLLGGCSFGAPTPEAYSFVAGDSVVVKTSIAGEHFSVKTPTVYSLNGVTHDEPEGRSTFVFAIKDLQAGSLRWKLEAARGDKKGSTEVTVEVPANAEAGGWKIIDCTGPSETFQARVSFSGDATKSTSDCGVSKTGEAELHVVGASTLHYEGQPLPATEGKDHRPHRVRVSVLQALASVPLSKVIGTYSKSAEENDAQKERELKLSASKDGAASTVSMKPSSSRSFGYLLTDMMRGETKSLGGAKPPPKDKPAAMLVDGYGNLFGLYGAEDKMADLALLAIVTDGKEVKLSGTCGPYSIDGRGAGEKSVDHYKRNRTIVVHRADTGAELARKVFEPQNPVCPNAIDSESGHATSSPRAEVLFKWLEEVRRQSIDKSADEKSTDEKSAEK